MNSVRELLDELDRGIQFEIKRITNSNCTNELEKHTRIYGCVKETIEKWHVAQLHKAKKSASIPTIDEQVETAIKKLLNKGYKECYLNFNNGVIRAAIDRSCFDLEKYLDKYNIPINSKFYYQERNGYCDLVTFGLGMQGVKDGYVNGSAFIDKKYILHSENSNLLYGAAE